MPDRGSRFLCSTCCQRDSRCSVYVGPAMSMATGKAFRASATNRPVTPPCRSGVTMRAVEHVRENLPGALFARQLDEGVLPDGFAERQPGRVIEEPAIQPRGDDDEYLPRMAAGKDTQVMRAHATHRQPAVLAMQEQLRMLAPQLQGLPGEKELAAAVFRVLQQFAQRRGA